MTVALPRRLIAEATGTGLLVAVVVGSGIAAQRLSPHDTGLQLLENSTATALGLAAIVLIVGPVSGAHLNPVVTLVDRVLGRRTRTGLPARDVAPYLAAQACGAVAGGVLANGMFDLDPLQLSHRDRITAGHLIGEVVATAGLVLLVFALTRTGRGHLAAPAVAAYIGSAYWFTSSTSFANPAVTLGRTVTDTFAGVAPPSAAAFMVAQLAGGLLGAGLVVVLHPDPGRAGDPVLPHPALETTP